MREAGVQIGDRIISVFKLANRLGIPQGVPDALGVPDAGAQGVARLFALPVPEGEGGEEDDEEGGEDGDEEEDDEGGLEFVEVEDAYGDGSGYGYGDGDGDGHNDNDNGKTGV